MTRPRLTRARRRAPRPAPPLPFLTESEPAWLELGRSELRLRRDGGDVAWSSAWPDADAAAAGAEWATHDLAALGAAGESDPTEPGEEAAHERS